MKVIFHLDLDSYFASAARTVDSRLWNKPIVISSGGERSIATAVSYEAKALGIKTAMPLYRARALVKDLIVVKPDFGLYTYLSTRMFEYLFEHYTNLIEVGSIDECYLDVTDIWQPYGSPRKLALKIQEDIFKTFKLPISIGISNNKFVAKMASPIGKPRGITILPSENFLAKCGSWPLIKFYGIGEPTAAKMNKLGLFTIADLAKAKVSDLKPIVGILADNYVALANGHGNDEINTGYNELKGIGNEMTFQFGDKVERNDILAVLASLVELVAQRMKNRNFMGRIISVSLKVSGGKEVPKHSLQKALPRPVWEYKDILREATALFDVLWNEGSVKFIGIRMGELSDIYDSTFQTSIFDAKVNPSGVDQIIKEVNHRLRTKAVVTGTEFKNEESKRQKQARYIESDRILKHYDVKGD